jgi:hypothetical protein
MRLKRYITSSLFVWMTSLIFCFCLVDDWTIGFLWKNALSITYRSFQVNLIMWISQVSSRFVFIFKWIHWTKVYLIYWSMKWTHWWISEDTFGLRELNFCSNFSINVPSLVNDRVYITSNSKLRLYTSGCYYLDRSPM